MSSSSSSALTGCSTCSRAALFLLSTSSRLSRSKCSRYLTGKGPQHPSQSLATNSFLQTSSLASQSALPQISIVQQRAFPKFRPEKAKRSPGSAEGKIVARSTSFPCALAARGEPWYPSPPPSPVSSLHQQQPAFPQRSDFRVGGETWARAPRPLSPIWVIASRAQPLGRLLVEPADVMGHRLPVRGVGLLLPPLSAPAAAVGTGSQPILKPCGEEPVTPVLASSQGPKDPLPGRPGSSPHYRTSFETRPSHLLCPGPSRMCVGGGTPPPGICGDGAPSELEGFPSPNSPSFPTPSRGRGLG